MYRLETLKRRLSAQERCLPEPAPWPPEPGTMGYLFWQDLGEPVERISFMAMYLEAARQFWAAKVVDEA